MLSFDIPLITQRYCALPSSFYSFVAPQPLDNCQWVAWNSDFAKQLSLPTLAPEGDLKKWWCGEDSHPELTPLAMKYAGHQFGVFNPDLGDGRGLLFGEITDDRGKTFDIHVKGIGRTPYSRMGDGRAVLRSTIREYLCSEAMHGLGVPTTRALGMLTSDTWVYRERPEQGALLIRLAESHVRFGHFEHLFYSNQLTELKQLADKVIDWYWPDCRTYSQPYAEMFTRVVGQTSLMIAHWQAYGFAHGVMNTDNMSILGQTFDYGPFAFLDDYDPNYICNHSDYQGRYAFDKQPSIALWNLSALAHALSPLIEREELELALNQFEVELAKHFSQLMRNKLGLLTKVAGDGELFDAMFTLLQNNQVDYTRFMRELSNLDRKSSQAVLDLFVDRNTANVWLDRYLKRCELEVGIEGEPLTPAQRCEQMRKVNPKYILRNYLAQRAIEHAEQGDFSQVETLLHLLKRPFDEQPEFDAYANLPPEWGKEMEISCSS